MNKENIKNYIILFLVVIILVLLILNFRSKDYIVSSENNVGVNLSVQPTNLIEQEKINRNFFPDEINLKDYSGVDFKLSEEGKKMIDNARNLHSIPTFIALENRDKELCAGYLWILAEKMWGVESPYYIGMQNKKEGKPSKAWELPNYYKYFGGKILIDFTGKFDLGKKNVYESISDNDLKNFFSLAFSEESLFGDIGFLYKDTQYTSFLKNWHHNSHIVKNLGVSKFEFTLNKDIENKENHINVLKNILSCDSDINEKLLKIFENYKFKLNGKNIVLDKGDFYYFKENNLSYLNKETELILLEKVKFKYLDKLEYKDVIIADFFERVGKVHSLLKFTCEGKFYPVNISSINPRFVEKY